MSKAQWQQTRRRKWQNSKSRPNHERRANRTTSKRCCRKFSIASVHCRGAFSRFLPWIGLQLHYFFTTFVQNCCGKEPSVIMVMIKSCIQNHYISLRLAPLCQRSYSRIRSNISSNSTIRSNQHRMEQTSVDWLV